jgi:hypothetical protein
MKIIGRDKFGLLYDKLYEYLEKTDGNISGVGIEKGTTNEVLTQLWNAGKTWETITLIIAYHYSRTETLMLKISKTSTMILRGASFREIQRTLGIRINKEEISRCIIPEEDFKDEYEKIEEMFKGVTTKKQFSAVLEGLGITFANRSLLVGYWKGKRLWEVIVAIIILLRAGTFDDIIVQTEKGEIRYKGGKQDCYLVLEEIENVLLAG